MVALWTPALDTQMGRSLLRDLRAVYPLQYPNGGAADLVDRKNANNLTATTGGATAAGPSSKLARATQFVRANSEYWSASDVAAHSFAGDMTAIVWVKPDTKP